MKRLEKYQPERTCCACGQKASSHSMLRVVSPKGKPPRVDVGGKLPGRGTYLCINGSCVEKALQRRALERMLKLEIALEGRFKDELRTAIAELLAAKDTSPAS